MLNVKKIINDSNIAFGTSGARGLVIDFSHDVCAAFTHAFLSVIDDKYNFNKVALAIDVAKTTRNIVWQNIYFAMGVKLIFIVLGVFGVATMWEAVFGDMGVALIAIFNALRILKK